MLSNFLNYVSEELVSLSRCADVQIHKLIRTLSAVSCAHFDRVSEFAQIVEVDTLDYGTRLDVKTGNYAFCDHKRMSSNDICFSYIALPTMVFLSPNASSFLMSSREDMPPLTVTSIFGKRF